MRSIVHLGRSGRRLNLGLVLTAPLSWLWVALTFCFVVLAPIAQAQVNAQALDQGVGAQGRLSAHITALREEGRAPLPFVLRQLQAHDLIVFDDGLHTAADPFDFYIELVNSRAFQELTPYVFLEVIPVNRQAALDRYFATYPEDTRLLYPAFQENFGWPYQSYFDLLHAIHMVNGALPEERRIKVVAVSTPSMWREIQTDEDWRRHVETMPLARDYFMYAMIRDCIGDRGKGIFLTNTRHAYARLRSVDGSPVRSATAFFELWHPGRAYSIRFNTPVLVVSARRDVVEEPRTAAGMEEYEFRWGRVAGGLWDEAFAEARIGPRAVPLGTTPFGRAPYVGNLMLTAAAGQTMGDAYDAVIFLRPMEELDETALTSAIYTRSFRRELARRYRVAYSDVQLRDLMAQERANSLMELIERQALPTERRRLREATALGPADEWRRLPSESGE